MAIESENSDYIFVPEIDLIVCPVVNLCELPKHQFLCKVPDCKLVCTEYLAKVSNLRKDEGLNR